LEMFATRCKVAMLSANDEAHGQRYACVPAVGPGAATTII
jgi:hypothetical protein